MAKTQTSRTKLARLQKEYTKELKNRDLVLEKMAKIREQIESEQFNLFRATVKEERIDFVEALDALSVLNDNEPQKSGVAVKEQEDELI